MEIGKRLIVIRLVHQITLVISKGIVDRYNTIIVNQHVHNDFLLDVNIVTLLAQGIDARLLVMICARLVITETVYMHAQPLFHNWPSLKSCSLFQYEILI